MRNIYIKLLIIVSITFILTACGGGNSSNSSSDPDTVGVDGGTITFPGNITINFPPYAVSKNTKVTAVHIDPSETQSILNSTGNRPRQFLGGISLKPSGPLGEIVEVSFPLEYLPADNELPIHYVYDDDYDAYYPANTAVSISPESNTATLYLNEFSDHVIAGVTNVVKRNCNESEPCRCGDFDVFETSSDRSFSQQDCQASDISGKIVYHACGDLTESWVFSEHTHGCVPMMSLNTVDSVIAPGESTQLEATVSYLTDAVPDIGVYVSANPLVTLGETSLLTDVNGEASTTVTGGNTEGVGTIDASATMTYASKIIAVNGIEQSVVERTKTMSASTDVIVGIPDWAGTMTLEIARCMGYLDIGATECIGAQYSLTATMEFVLVVDELNTNPSINNPNVTGIGSVAFSSVQTTDGVIRNIDTLSCPTAQTQEYIPSTKTFPFTTEIIGLEAANAVGIYDLFLHFTHPSTGLNAVFASFDYGSREFCNGVIVSTFTEPNWHQLYWNPGIEHDWDPLWADDFGFRLNLTGEDVIYKTGECGGFYNGKFIGPYEKCNYTLNLMKT